MLPILELRPDAERLVDAALLAAALLDLGSNPATQSDVNWAANALLSTSQHLSEDGAVSLKETFYMLVGGHLKVIYPRLWEAPKDKIQSLVSEATALSDVFSGKEEFEEEPLAEAA